MDEIEQARKIFARHCDFTRTVVTLDNLPDGDMPEVAFAGRSNVGKSSLLNALTNRKLLARVSNTPGRTRALNFFDLGGHGHLVDMPGYGYAKVSKTERSSWQALLRDYVRGRPNLRGVLLLIDARRGIGKSDHEFLSLLDEAGVAARIILTKADKIKSQEEEKLNALLAAALKKHPSAFPVPTFTSSHKGSGIEQVRQIVAQLMGILVSSGDGV